MVPVRLDVVGSTKEFNLSGSWRKSLNHPVDLVWFVAGGSDLCDCTTHHCKDGSAQMTANSERMTKCLINYLSNNDITVQASVEALRVPLHTHLGTSKLCLVAENNFYE